jgi:hypothetical protein
LAFALLLLGELFDVTFTITSATTTTTTTAIETKTNMFDENLRGGAACTWTLRLPLELLEPDL